MTRLTGKVIFAQESRFKLRTQDGRCKLFLLANDASHGPQDGRTTSDKILAVILAIAAFVAAGLEHLVANMFLVPYGLFVKLFADASFWTAVGGSAADFPALTFWGVFSNLIPVTFGNIVGGALIGTAYWYVYRRHA
jgi:formate/nitrite transporter FocA (FNT family)